MGERVVYDTNTFISALGWNAKPEQCLELVFRGRAEGYLSPDIYNEIQRVMEYPRFEFTEEEKQTFLDIVLGAFRMVNPRVNVEVVTADQDDDMILECALAVDARYIVTGDSHLTDLGTFKDVEIVSPAAFLHRMDERGAERRQKPERRTKRD